MLTLFLAVAASSAQAGEDQACTFVEALFAKMDVRLQDEFLDSRLEPDGDGFTVSAALSSRFFIQANYYRNEDDTRVTVESLSRRLSGEQRFAAISLGVHTAVAENADLVARVGHARRDITLQSDDLDSEEMDNTVFVSAGLRSRLGTRLETGANLTWHNDRDNELSKEIYGQLYLTQQLSPGMSYSRFEDADLSGIFARVSF